MMSQLLNPVLVTSISFVASLLAVRALIGYLLARDIMDRPVDRSSHTTPTPRGGGLAVSGTIVLVWLGLQMAFPAPGFSFLLVSVLLLAAISWRDDLASLSSALRLAVHGVAVLVGLFWLNGQGLVFQGLLPPYVDLVVSGFVWVGFLNFFNFMDGIDGISAVETIAIVAGLALAGGSLGYALFELSEVFHILAIGGAMAGFALWNWHPAKIFLGDVGSVPLGFLLGGLLLGLAARGGFEAALILPLYYLADAGLTLCRRIVRGEKFWQAHRSHFYQRAVQRGFSHSRVSLAIALANTLLVICAFWSVTAPALAIFCAALVVLFLLVWMVKWPVASS